MTSDSHKPLRYGNALECACLASTRPWVQTLATQEKKKKKWHGFFKPYIMCESVKDIVHEEKNNKKLRKNKFFLI
jgi:hypothetical protein